MWLILEFNAPGNCPVADMTQHTGQSVRKLSEKADVYPEVYREVGILDMTISTASFRKSLPWYCLPEFADDSRMPVIHDRIYQPRIYMEDIYHPLIRQSGSQYTGTHQRLPDHRFQRLGKISTFIKAVAGERHPRTGAEHLRGTAV